MVGYIAIDPNEVHSKSPYAFDQDMSELLDNRYSITCFAQEHQFIDAFTNCEAENKKLLEQEYNCFGTYMLVDQKHSGKWIGMVQFYNADWMQICHMCSDLSLIDSLSYFFHNKEEFENSVSWLNQAAGYAINQLTGTFSIVDRKLTDYDLMALEQDLMKFKKDGFKNDFQNQEKRRYWKLQMEAILENSPQLAFYFRRCLERYIEGIILPKNMYMNVFLASDFLHSYDEQVYLEIPKVLESVVEDFQSCLQDKFNIIPATSITNSYMNEFKDKVYLKNVS